MTNQDNNPMISIKSISIDKEETSFKGGAKINIQLDIPNLQNKIYNIDYQINHVVTEPSPAFQLNMSCWAVDKSKKETLLSKRENILKRNENPGSSFVTCENSYNFLLAESECDDLNIHIDELKGLDGDDPTPRVMIFFRFKIKGYDAGPGEFYTTPFSNDVVLRMYKDL